jgi:mRNA-degrading endonuclease RelE of RelBE toxin-antitoxin system
MIYQIEFKPRALKDLRAIDKREARRLVEKIKVMENDLAGDVKRLTNFTREYRLRVALHKKCSSSPPIGRGLRGGLGTSGIAGFL